MNYRKAILGTIAGILALSASAADFTVGGISYNIVSLGRQTCEVTSIGGERYYSGNIVVPEKVVDSYDNTEYTVIAVGQKAFSYCQSLESVQLPNTIQSLKKDAFSGASITSLTIPTSCRYIGESCFWGAKLTDITIPGSVDTIQNHAFRMCRELKTLKLEEGVKYVGEHAFNSCETLVSALLPASLNTICHHAFKGCELLPSITIPAGLENYGGGLFEECAELSAISVDPASTRFKAVDGVLYSLDGTILYEYPYGKVATTYEVVPGTEKIWDYAFELNPNFTSLKLADSTKEIGDYTFNGMANLTEIDLGQSLETIGEHAFMDCQKVETFNFPKTLRNIDSMAISRAYGLTEIVLPDSVESLGDWAFFGCQNVTVIRIGTGLKTMAKTVFQRCYGVTEVYCSALEPPTADGLQWQSDNYDKSTLHVPQGTKAEYAAAEGWKEFAVIIDDIELSGIESVISGSDSGCQYIALDGRLLQSPAPGTICIERKRTSDGVSTRKVIIR